MLENEIFQKNIDFFLMLEPSVSQRIIKFGKPKGQLVAVGDDDFDLERSGGRLYGQGAKALAKAQIIENFSRESDWRVVMTPPQSNDGIDKHGSFFFLPLLQEAVESDVQFYARRCDMRAVNALVFGIGLGQHLPLLIERAACRTLIIFEPDFELFVFSLLTLDWEALFERAKAKSINMRLILNDEPLSAAIEAIDAIRYGGFAPFVDGTLLFNHLRSPALDKILAAIADRRHTLAHCFGFIEDELLMLSNTARNLDGFGGRLFKSGANIDLPPVFLVGSGPSLDETLPHIKRLADRAIIISCGTALRVLIDNGVKPDIHVELENAPESYEALRVSVESRDISDVLLFASSTVDHRLSSHFSRTIFFFRRELAISSIFAPSEEFTLTNVSPNVSNLAVVFINELACRDVYLFGIDLGTKDPKHHHCSTSPYMKGELAWNWQYDIVLPGNFGGQVHTEWGYVASKVAKEREIIYRGQGRNYFNLSHGLAIDGAHPLRAQSLELPPLTSAKASIVEKLWQRFPQHDQDQFKKSYHSKDLAKGVSGFIQGVLNDVCSIEDSYESTIDGLLKISQHLHADYSDAFFQKMLRGTIMLMINAAYFYLVRTGTPEHRQFFARLTRQSLAKSLPLLAQAVMNELAAMGWRSNSYD
jgi:hypothetical protein